MFYKALAFTAFLLLLVPAPVFCQEDVTITTVFKADSTFPRLRANAYFSPVEDKLDSTNLQFVARLEACAGNRQNAIKDMFGYLALRSKQIGANGYKFVKFYFDTTAKNLKLQFDVYHLNDSLLGVNKQLKPKGKIFIINAYQPNTIYVDRDPLFFKSKTWFSLDLSSIKKYKLRASKDGAACLVDGSMLKDKSQYFLTKDSHVSLGSMGLGYALFGVAGVVIASVDPEGKLKPIDENLANILMKIYRQASHEEVFRSKP